MSDENAIVVKSDDTNALAAYQQASQQALAKQSDSQFEELAKAADYLCRLQLCGSNSTLFKNDQIAKGHYAYIINKEKFNDLGESVDIYPMVWRPKALDMSGDSPMSFYNPDSNEFKATQTKAGTKDSQCTFGPEFLVWIPSIKKFASLHFGSKTSRQDAPDLMKLMKASTPATLTWRKVGPNDKGQIWETMVINPCSTGIEMPPIEAYNKAILKFQEEQNAPAPEKADAPAEGTRAR